MKSTIDACVRPDMTSNDIKQIFSDQQIEEITNKLKKLSLKDQMDIDFIVPLPSLEEGISKPIQETKKEEKKQEKESQPKKEEKDLDSWLDGLLGV